jgi:hypothetical protein
MWTWKGLRKYDLLAHVPYSTNKCKRQKLLTDESIREVATKDCYIQHCCQMFPWKKMMAIWEENEGYLAWRFLPYIFKNT